TEAPRAITAVSNEHGTFVLCNVPASDATLRVRADGWQPGDVPIQVRAGVVLWQDVWLDPAPTAPSAPAPG
ncbi:MAG TPA: hypothetical protein VJ957_08630, partial [Longimicrobiales bacterium]|nr:hypothetical protein [Longimicrobiales bacterium]